MKTVSPICPSCEEFTLKIFYEIEGCPAHSALALDTRKEAINYPRGKVALGFCPNCGFISNVAFDPRLHDYSARYEPSQGCSNTFNAFHRALAADLVKRYNLYDKDIIEIGCGKGEFLIMLCEAGGNRGIGFDPAYVDNPRHSEVKEKVNFIKDYFSEKYADNKADFICCKMTLEHIHNTAEFVNMVRRSCADRPETIVFFQLPDVKRILNEIAFWDIYYEHCSYFSMGSLSRLFRKCGFDVIDLWRNYDYQYLMIAAKPDHDINQNYINVENDLEEISRSVDFFKKNYKVKLKKISDDLRGITKKRQRCVIWGAGSKGVAFLTTLKIQNEIRYAVDINPVKHGTYMAGTGQEIVAPELMKEYKPDVVIVMNPIYCNEIRVLLDKLGIQAKLMPLS